jgi:hypothetical protein
LSCQQNQPPHNCTNTTANKYQAVAKATLHVDISMEPSSTQSGYSLMPLMNVAKTHEG